MILPGFPKPLAMRRGGLSVADVFATALYTGNGANRSIVNGLDLAGEGGAVWIKGRNNTNTHQIYDTDRGAAKYVTSVGTTAEQDLSSSPSGPTLSAFNADGFSLGANSLANTNILTYVAWSFRQAPGFFDVVTYSGNGAGARAIAHGLGVAPGFIIVKRLDAAASMTAWHAGLGSNQNYGLNASSAVNTSSAIFPTGTNPHTASDFYVGSSAVVNNASGTHVAYLFAADEDNVKCGTYTGSGGTQTISVGFEPQFLFIRHAHTSSAVAAPQLFDSQRGGNGQIDVSNTAAEQTFTTHLNFTSNGFQLLTSFGQTNQSTVPYTYVAIRTA